MITCLLGITTSLGNTNVNSSYVLYHEKNNTFYQEVVCEPTWEYFVLYSCFLDDLVYRLYLQYFSVYICMYVLLSEPTAFLFCLKFMSKCMNSTENMVCFTRSIHCKKRLIPCFYSCQDREGVSKLLAPFRSPSASSLFMFSYWIVI